MSKFVSFITAGDPSIEKTKEFLNILIKHSDVVEVGLPFSDPIAEGEVIEAANMRALSAGVTTDKVFDMLKEIDFDRLVILTYINPVFVYGYKRFFARCKDSGVWAVIIPDLPFEERSEAESVAKKYGVIIITLIAPTSGERIKMLAEKAEGFIYLVSSMGTTGIRSEFNSNLKHIVSKIKEVTDTPVYVGFGISTREHVEGLNQFADGVIVGSAFVRIIEKHGCNSAKYIENFIKELKGEQ